MTQQLYTGYILNKIMASEKVIRLEIAHESPSEMIFEPGQFINLKVNEDSFRSYSICSSFRDSKKIDIVVSFGYEGVGANYCRDLVKGAKVQYVGPSGKMRLKPTNKDYIVFFATGTGMAPFISMLDKLSLDGYKGEIAIFCGFRTEQDILFKNEIEHYEETLNITYEFFLSQPETVKYRNGYVTKVLPEVIAIPADFYVCGHPDMVRDVTQGLIDGGVLQENIVSEKFTRSQL